MKISSKINDFFGKIKKKVTLKDLQQLLVLALK